MDKSEVFGIMNHKHIRNKHLVTTFLFRLMSQETQWAKRNHTGVPQIPPSLHHHTFCSHSSFSFLPTTTISHQFSIHSSASPTLTSLAPGTWTACQENQSPSTLGHPCTLQTLTMDLGSLRIRTVSRSPSCSQLITELSLTKESPKVHWSLAELNSWEKKMRGRAQQVPSKSRPSEGRLIVALWQREVKLSRTCHAGLLSQ